MKIGSLLIASSGWVVLSGAASAGVIVVAAGGGGSFTDIQPAVNAAANGDTILVKPGTYTTFTINAKGLTVVGDVGTISVAGRVLIENLSAAQAVTLANIKATGGPGFTNALQVEDCAGAVRFVACHWFGGDDGPGMGPNGAGVGGLVLNSGNIAFAGCTIIGGDGMSGHTCLFDTVTFAEEALTGAASSIALYDCIVTGGHGGNGGDWTEPGGDAIRLHTGFLFAGRSNITGGHGGDTDCGYSCPDTGGAGWDLATTASAWVLECMISGGLGGTQGTNPFGCPPGQQGPTYPDQTPFTFGVPSIGFMSPHVAREGDFVVVKFIGPPGAHVYLNDELTTTFEGVASWRGVLLSPFPERGSGPERTRRWGVIPSSGELNQVYKVPMLPSGVQAQTRFLQAYRIGANGITLGSFRTLTVLDSSF
jgi:hypothetical protein